MIHWSMALLSLLLMASCSTKKKSSSTPDESTSDQSTQVSEHAKEVPAWAYAPSEGCDEEAEICASGEGKNSSVADANALKSLAAIFETKITSTTQADAVMSQDQAYRSSRENAYASVREEVSQTLEAASIRQRHRHKGLSYSLAVLDKEKAAGSLITSMNRAQAELEGLWKRRDRTGWARMWQLLLTRDGIADRLFLITGSKRGGSPTAADLQGWYQGRKAQHAIGWESAGLSPELEGALKSRLTEAGWILQKSAVQKVRATLEAKQTHLQVKGFEKWEFVLTMQHLGTDGNKVGVLTAETTTTGRSRVDCESKARAELLRTAETELTKLNLAE